jgi:aryl sulfotransferase
MPALLKSATRTVHSRVFDSARWNGYQPRSDDIIIGTFPKCGTTWMQRIVSMLVFQSAAPRPLWDMSPWLDMRMHGPVEPLLAAAEAQMHRRFFKTHLPFDALPIYEGVKFIHVARDGRDAAMSQHNHLFNFSAASVARFNDVNRSDPKFGDDFPVIPESAGAYFTDWITDGGSLGDPGTSFFHVENTYWAARHDSNVLLVHYDDLKADCDSEMRRVAAFLGITIRDALWPDIVTAAGFDAMKDAGDVLLPAARGLWADGASQFLYRGTNGRWRGVVSTEDLAHYDAAVKVHFTPDLARWLAGGRMAGADPERV